MSWSKEQIDFGVVKQVDRTHVRVHKNSTHYDTIQITSDEITGVNWSSGNVVVSLKSGHVRRYRDTSHYDNV